MSYVLIYNVTILSIQTYTFAKMVKLIHKRSENNFLLIKVLCMILVDVVGNVLALLKLFGVANVWQASRNFLENVFWCLFRTGMLFHSMLWFSLSVCWKTSEEVYSLVTFFIICSSTRQITKISEKVYSLVTFFICSSTLQITKISEEVYSLVTSLVILTETGAACFKNV